jgi:hypothetical protein
MNRKDRRAHQARARKERIVGILSAALAADWLDKGRLIEGGFNAMVATASKPFVLGWAFFGGAAIIAKSFRPENYNLDRLQEIDTELTGFYDHLAHGAPWPARGPIGEEFDGMKAASMDDNPPPHALQEARVTFFSGAQHTYSSIMLTLDPGIEPTDRDERRIAGVFKELEGILGEATQAAADAMGPAKGNA